MNMQYRILWIDDSPDYIESTQELIEEAVRQSNMNPMVKVYSRYSDFQEAETKCFDEEVFNQYDQIVVQ